MVSYFLRRLVFEEKEFVMNDRKKKLLGGLRLNLPEKTGGAHGSKKGKRGYNRARDRHQFRQDWL